MTQAKGKIRMPEALGWGFWCIVFLVAIGPSVWGFWQLSYGGSAKLTAVALGFTCAAIAAGFVTWLANAAVQWWHARQRSEQKKESKRSGGKS